MARSKQTATDVTPQTQTESGKKPKKTMLERPSAGLPIQPRTMLLPRPAMFFCEPNAPKHVLEAQEANDFDRLHQVDPNRPSSCAPVMPNLDLLRETGNPYPDSAEHETVITRSKWQKYVPLLHAVFKIMSEAAEPKAGVEIINDAVQMAGVGTNKAGEISNEANYVVSDTLRDLRLYGIAQSDEPTAFFKKTKYQIVEQPEKIALA